MAPKGFKGLWLNFNEAEWAYIQARCAAECRNPTSMAKSATVFYAKYGPWKLSTEGLEANNTLLRLPIKLKASDIP